VIKPLDEQLVPPLPTDRPLRILELFAGVGTGTHALARLGYQTGEVVACEARGAARVVHAHSLSALATEFPKTVANKARAQLHHRLPQDICLVSAEHLRELGPVDLVVAGWPCQGSSAAGTGQGLDDARSGLFTELMRVLGELQALHKAWRHLLGYLIEHVSAGSDRRPRMREHFEAVRGVLGPELVLDAAQLGLRAHRLRAWWTNLEGMALLRAALGAQVRPRGLFVHQVLGLGRRAKTSMSTGVLPWAKVEIPGEPGRALNTFVSYGGSYAFFCGGGSVLACIQPDGGTSYEEPTAEERELAMGFPRGFTAAKEVSEHTRRQLLGQAMDLNSVMWVLAAARSTGAKRSPLGGEAVRVSPLAAGGVTAQNIRSGATGQGTGGARGGGRVSLPPQPVGRRAEAGAAGPGATGQGAGGARGGGRVSLLPQPVGRRAEAGAAIFGAMGQGAGGARGGGRVSLLPQPVAVKGAGSKQKSGAVPSRTGSADVRAPVVQMAGATLLARSVGSGGSVPAATGSAGVQAAGAEGAGLTVGVQAKPLEVVRAGEGPNKEGWKVGAQLTAEEGSYVATMVERNRDAFAFSLEEIGEFKLFEVELKLKSDQPIFERQRRHSVREWELVDERCKELEAAGIIEECDSDFAANSVMGAKKDPEGNWKLARFCTDLRRINEQTAQDRYPMPLPEEVLEGLGHAKFYSTIDIRGAFHQLVVKKEDRRKLAFWSSSKLYCWKRCPFGARNVSAWFQRAIDRTLRGLEGFARSFVGDLLVAGGETVEEHMELVQRVFDRLKEVGLRCHPEKCCFAATEVEYLGMWLRPGVVSPQLAKVAAIAALPRPTDVTSVRAFSGVVNYYRQFIPDSSRLHAPLNALTKKGAPWKWGPDQERAFRALKEALQGEPLLVLPKRGRPSKVWCDWSRKGVGGVLLQKDDAGSSG
jgi:hypothetical protein